MFSRGGETTIALAGFLQMQGLRFAEIHRCALKQRVRKDLHPKSVPLGRVRSLGGYHSALHDGDVPDTERDSKRRASSEARTDLLVHVHSCMAN